MTKCDVHEQHITLNYLHILQKFQKVILILTKNCDEK